MKDFNCGCANLYEHMSMQTVSAGDKLRIRTKYLLGSCAVQIVFLSGPKSGWDLTRKNRMVAQIKKGLEAIKTYRFQSDNTQTLPAVNFNLSAPPLDSSCTTDPTECFANGDKIQANVKQYLTDKGYYKGDIGFISPGWNEAKALQSLYDYNNDQRDKANTDWSFIIFVIPDSTAANKKEVAWASEKLGLMVITEINGDEDWVVSHETCHLFGALDEYGDHDSCRDYPGGMYQIMNSNCRTPDGLNCVMGGRGKTTVCNVTLKQLSLQKEATGEFTATKDFSYNKYDLNSQHLKQQNGVILTSDVLRAGRKVYIRASGSSKMNDWYSPHGPEGDKNTIVGNDHMLPGKPFSCVIGRFISMDKSKMSPWFEVGAGSRWFEVPFRSYFVFGINDKINSFSDNSGQMSIEIFAKLPDQLGAAWEYKGVRADELETLESVETEILNTEQFEARVAIEPAVAE